MRKYFPEVVNIFVMTAQERVNLYMKAIGYLNSDEKEEVKIEGCACEFRGYLKIL